MRAAVQVSFKVSGPNAVHISGYAIEHDDDDDELDMYNDEMVSIPVYSTVLCASVPAYLGLSRHSYAHLDQLCDGGLRLILV